MSTINNIDTNVNNYTLEDLLTILDVDSPDNTQEITDKTNNYINQFNQEKNTPMAVFFQDIQFRLLSGEDSSAKQTDNWFQNEALKQPNNPVQTDKTTERKQKIDVYDNHHVPMNRQQLGVNNNFNVPVSQDSLNPNLENITSRFINIDSQFRQATGGVESSSSDFTLDLSEPLNNALSMRLYSIQIPVTWYAIDTAYDNTCFWIVFNGDYSIFVSINVEPGNYMPQSLVNQLNNTKNFGNTAVFTLNNPAIYPASYNINNGKVTIDLTTILKCTINGVDYPIITTTTSSSTPPAENTTQIVFFDVNGCLNSGTSICNPGNGTINTINQTLGWIMGYRLPFVYAEATGNIAATIIDLYGPKYLILSIDDYNQNHINNGLITITELSKNLKLPSYYTPTMPQKCTIATSNLVANMQGNQGNQGNGDLLMDKLNNAYKKIPTVYPTAPRILTQAQIYTINSILQNNERNTNFRSKAPATSDTFALIPIKHNSTNDTGFMYVEISGSLQENKRIYFGPVNVDRMRIKLYDDKGNILNMNGADWSFTLISEILYQY